MWQTVVFKLILGLIDVAIKFISKRIAKTDDTVELEKAREELVKARYKVEENLK